MGLYAWSMMNALLYHALLKFVLVPLWWYAIHIQYTALDFRYNYAGPFIILGDFILTVQGRSGRCIIHAMLAVGLFAVDLHN